MTNINFAKIEIIMPVWLTIVLILLTLCTVLIWTLGLQWRTGIDIIILLAGSAGPIIKNTPKLYGLWSRVKFWLLNRDLLWNVEVVFEGVFLKKTLDEYITQLIYKNKRDNAKLEQNELRYLIKYEKFITLEFLINDTDAEEFKELIISILDLNIGYRRSKVILEDKIIPLIEEVQNHFNTKKAKYSLKISFESLNPFFGIYVQRLKTSMIKEFSLNFELPLNEGQGLVTVTKSDVIVVSDKLQSFRKSVIKALEF